MVYTYFERIDLMDDKNSLCVEFDTDEFLVYKWHSDSYKTLEKYVGNKVDIVLPEGIESVKENVFWHYEELKSIIFPRTIKKLYDSTLQGLEKLEKVVFKDSNIEEIPKWFFGGSGVKDVVLPNNLKIIGESAFCACNRLEKIIIPDSVEKIDYFAFYNCENLKQVIIGDNCKDINKSIFDGNCDYSSTKQAVLYYPDNFKYVDKIPKNIPAMPLSKLKSNNSKGCYIATCVYGSYDCPEVWTLRRFRDDILSESTFSRLFIKCYYAVSPTAVKLFGDYKWFHKLFKNPLDKLVEKLNSYGVENTQYYD